MSLAEEFAAAQADAEAWEAAHPAAAKALAGVVKAADADPLEPADGDQVEPAEPTEPTEPSEPSEPTEPDAAAADPAKAKRDQLAALAAELGMKVVGEQVAVEERVKFREEKRQHREARAKWEADANRFIAERMQPVAKAVEMLEAGDIDEGLKLLTGKDLTELNKDAIAASSGADWQTRQRLKRLEAERQAERAQLAQWQAQEQQRQQQERDRQYETHLRGELGKSEDKTVASAVADFPEFAGWVAAEQRRELDPEDGSTILAPVAARRVVDNMRSMYERLHKIFAAPGAAKKPESGIQAPAKPAQPRDGKPPARSTAAGGQLAAGRRSAPPSDAEWFREAKREIEAAARAERLGS